jgi:DNA-binding transcriptional LysR family regulator
VNLASLDLNLVVALRALLEERNVTNAGRRIGLSQPAMSAALARLRRHFDDDLLSREGGRYELTALGLALLDRTANACDLLERVFTSQADFDPTREEHEFTLIATDPGDLRITLKLNGETMQDESTKDMLFGIARLVSYTSQTAQLLPGDLVTWC